MDMEEMTKWLYYRSYFEYTLDASEFDDPKYLDEILPAEWKFREYILSCSLEEFVSTFILIFKDRYPRKYGQLRPMLAWDEEKQESVWGKAFLRKEKDISRLDFLEGGEEMWSPLQYVRMEFTEPQPGIQQWVTAALGGKPFQTHGQGDSVKYQLGEGEIIKQITASPNSLEIEINLDLPEEMYEL